MPGIVLEENNNYDKIISNFHSNYLFFYSYMLIYVYYISYRDKKYS